MGASSGGAASGRTAAAGGTTSHGRGLRSSDSGVFTLGDADGRVSARHSVTARLGLVISLAISVLTVVFGLVIYSVVSAMMSRQIDEEGVLAARVMALPAYETWRTFAGTPFQGREAEFADRPVPVPPDEQEGFLAITRRNRERLDRIFLDEGGERRGIGKLLDAVVLDHDRTHVVAGKQAVTIEPRRSERMGGVQIGHGTYQSIEARVYTAPVLNFDGVEAGWAVVTLSEERISEKLNRLLLYIFFLALLFLGLGVILSYYLGRRFSAPILALTEDVRSVARGDLDHRTRPHTKDEIGVLAMTFDQMTRNLKTAQEAERDHVAQRHQMNVAMEIQENLFPKELPAVSGFDIDAYHEAGEEGGGDFYDVLRLGGDRLGVMIASASGRGVAAAMVTTMVRSFLIAMAELHESPAELLRNVNRLLSPDMRRGLYVTMLLARADGEGGRLVLANAGHAPLICWREATGKVELVHSEGIALGFDRGPVFDRTLREVVLDLQKGDRAVLVTPSVFEITNAEGDKLGENRFYGLVAREAGKESKTFVKVVAHALARFRGGPKDGLFNQGLSVVTLSRIAPEESA